MEAKLSATLLKMVPMVGVIPHPTCWRSEREIYAADDSSNLCWKFWKVIDSLPNISIILCKWVHWFYFPLLHLLKWILAQVVSSLHTLYFNQEKHIHCWIDASWEFQGSSPHFCSWWIWVSKWIRNFLRLFPTNKYQTIKFFFRCQVLSILH